jgi:hypothetical protein
MAAGTSSDPHWDLVIEIAAKLWIDRAYSTEIPSSPAQPFVDVQWAARQAGRILGGRSKIHMRHSKERDDHAVTVTVTYVDADGAGLANVEERLEALMRTVLEEHERLERCGSSAAQF